MQKNIAIIVLAVISLALIGYIVFMGNTNTISSADAESRVETFINESLLPPGTTATIGEISQKNGLYAMPVTLPDGTTINTYLSKDGQIFFPEGMNIDEITEEISNANQQNNNQDSMGELQIETLAEGSGDQVVENGNTVTVHYTGTLEDGTEFDSSRTGDPFTFTVGQGQVIQGWEQGLLGMKVGEERKLTIPSSLGYGSTGAGQIPPNATLIFTIELISIE